MILAPAQIATLAKAAGWAGQDIITAVAVALGESGGNPAAHTVDSDDDSWGLYQINMRGGMGPERRRRFGLASDSALADPTTNARVAHSIWKDQGWDGWGAYSSGAYRRHLDTARKAAGAPAPVPGGTTPAGGGGGSSASLVEALLGVNQTVKTMAEHIISGGKVADLLVTLFLPSNLMRLGVGAAGVVFIFAGIAILGREIRM